MAVSSLLAALKREKANLTRPCGGGLFCQYNRYETITRFMRETERRRPQQVRVQSLGLTHEGRDILVMQISGDGGATGRPVVLLEAGAHAREWIAPAAALRVMQGLAEDPHHADLLRHLDWHVVPVLNPDGYEYSYTTSRFWRKNRGKNKGSQCRGNDINRNFDFHWNEIGTSPDPCSSGYPGPRPFSSLESIALKNYALKHKHRIKLYLSLHSHGSYILYPWGYTTELPSDWSLLHSVAVKADEAQVKAGGLPYVIGNSAKTLYPAAGCSDDWMKAVCGVNLSYTVELPGGGERGFDMPPEYIQDTVNYFFEAARAFGKELERLLLSSTL